MNPFQWWAALNLAGYSCMRKSFVHLVGVTKSTHAKGAVQPSCQKSRSPSRSVGIVRMLFQRMTSIVNTSVTADATSQCSFASGASCVTSFNVRVWS